MLLSEFQVKSIKDIILDVQENWETMPKDRQEAFIEELPHLKECVELTEELINVIKMKSKL